MLAFTYEKHYICKKIPHTMLHTRLAQNFDRSFSGKWWKQIAWLAGTITVVFFILYIIGIYCGIDISAFSAHEDKESSFFRFLINLFIDPGNVYNLPKEHLWYATIVAITGMVLFVGILITVISNMLERRIEHYREGDIRYSLSGHIIIIGFDKIAPSLIRQLCNDKNYQGCQILIQSVQPTLEIRDKLHEFLSKEQERRIVIFHARRNSEEELLLLNTHKAREVFLLGENDEPDHDFINIECLKKIVTIHKRLPNCPKVSFTVLFEYQSTFAAFQITDLASEWRQYIKFHPINYHEEWAKRLIVKRQYGEGPDKITYPSLDGRNGLSEDSPHYVHLVIIGMSRMGVALGVEAAQLMHFPNFNRDKSLRTRITFISNDAEQEMNYFIGRYSHFFEVQSHYYMNLSQYTVKDITQSNFNTLREHLAPTKFQGKESDFLDIEYTFIQGDTTTPQAHKLFEMLAKDTNAILSIAVCISDPPASIAMGLYLPDIIYQKDIPVFIRQKTSSALLDIIRRVNEKNPGFNKYRNVYPFGMREQCFDLGHNELYRALGIQFLYANSCDSLPTSIPPKEQLLPGWDDTEIALRWSNYYSSYSINPKLRSLGINENNECPELTEKQIEIIAQVEHNRWNVEKLLLGYRKPDQQEAREMSRNELKLRFIHPDIVPYDELSTASKDYDRAIAAGIPLLSNTTRER